MVEMSFWLGSVKVRVEQSSALVTPSAMRLTPRFFRSTILAIHPRRTRGCGGGRADLRDGVASCPEMALILDED